MDWFSNFANLASLVGAVSSIIILRIARRVKPVRIAYAVIPSIQLELQFCAENLGKLLEEKEKFNPTDFRIGNEIDSATARLMTIEKNVKSVWHGTGMRTQNLLLRFSNVQSISYADASLIRRGLVQTLEELKEFRRMEPFEV